MSITETYADYCSNLRFEDLPTEVVGYAKRLTLDTVGIMAGAASRADSSAPIIAGVLALNGDETGATVIATGEQLSPAYAGLLNGTLAHSLDYDDTHRASSLHPGAPVVAAALAAAEREAATGKELLTGIVAGYEVGCRVGMAVNAKSHYARGFHGTATCGTFGATAAAKSVKEDVPACRKAGGSAVSRARSFSGACMTSSSGDIGPSGLPAQLSSVA